MKHHSIQTNMTLGDALKARRVKSNRPAPMRKSKIKLPLDVGADSPLLTWGLLKHPTWVLGMLAKDEDK